MRATAKQRGRGQVVFNDAVVDQSNAAVLADVGMGVDVVGLPVGGPAGVPDTQGSLQVRPVMGQVRARDTAYKYTGNRGTEGP